MTHAFIRRILRIIPMLLCCFFLVLPAQAGQGQAVPAGALNPGDLHYLGAFRLPENGSDEAHFYSFGGEALAFNPRGDEGRGSLYYVGHNWHTSVAEISIPAPARSKNPADLPQARQLQPFTNIRGALFDRWAFEITRVGLEVVDNLLYFCWGSHYEPDTTFGTHGARSLDLSVPAPGAVCRIRTEPWTYATNDYLLAIPKAWSDQHLPGYDLASGRFRDGGWSGMGPALFALRGADVQTAAMDGLIPATPLILYDADFDNENAAKLDGYAEPDHFAGAAWVHTDTGGALIFAGTHGFGKSWYGFANGVVFSTWDEEGNEIYAEVPDPPYTQRGWWNDDFRPVLMLYNPEDLAKTAKGQMQPNHIQPYAFVDLREYMLKEQTELDQILLGDIAHDPARGMLYLLELMADGDKPIVHVFQVGK